MTQIGFKLLREEEIPELRTRARLYEHVKTGAEVLSLENDDENKVFGITFRTPPIDSTGLPHILEHSVLGGSRKYPVKDPFNELVKGSLKTFLNASTFPDKTAYPIASPNLKDFYNLADVYLDAVLYPLITPHKLDQEGWHYEVDSHEAPLVYKGVVFNEMKGTYSSPQRVMGDYTLQALFPDTVYRFSAGGRPREIPGLTYENFVKYHQTYYHPSNARIWFYGDDDPQARLRLVDEYLSEFERREVDSEIALQPRFDAPRQIRRTYAIGQDTDARKKSILTVNWMLDEIRDPTESLALDILGHILVGTPASPLRRALIDSGLGEELAGGGMSDYLRQATFGTGLRGIESGDADRVEQLVLQTLATLAASGIDKAMVEASLNTVEFSLRENNTGSYPRGLALMFRALTSWLHGGDPLALLKFEKPLSEVKERVAAGERLFEGLIERYLLSNPHRVTVLLEPDPEQGLREEAEEQQRLAEARAEMTPEQIQALVDNTRELKRIQDTLDKPEMLALVPRLTLADLDRENKEIPISVEERVGTKVLYHDLFTNGILYLDVGFDLHTLSEESLLYMPLFGRAILEMGTEREDFVRLAQRIGRKTGGVWSDISTATVRDSEVASALFFLRGKSTMEQVNELLAIMREVLLEARFDDRERFRQIVLESKARREASIMPSGSGYVNTRLGAHFTEADWAGEQVRGLRQLLFVRQLAEDIERDWPGVLAALESIRERLVSRTGMLVNVTLDETNWQAVAPQLDEFLGALPNGARAQVTWTMETPPPYEGIVIPGQVNYVGKAARLYDLGYEMHGSADVVTRYLQRTWLHDQVRVRGGAYGGFALFNRLSGVFTYLSYRDPNLLATLRTYDDAPRYLRSLDMNDDELAKAIIGTISGIDTYRLPDAKGWVSMQRYLVGQTPERRQKMRDEILGTSPGDFKAFADVLERVNEDGRVTVLGAQSALDQASSARPGWLDVWKLGL